MHIEGRVMVQLVVDTAGLPRDCKVVSAEPSEYFEEEALKAAEATRFIPGKLQGKAVNTLVVIPYQFRLR
jgi:protein TonB